MWRGEGARWPAKKRVGRGHMPKTRRLDPLPVAHLPQHTQAARRRAVTELMFFASVGDLKRVERIVKLWKLNVSRVGGGGGNDKNTLAQHAHTRLFSLSPPVPTGG